MMPIRDVVIFPHMMTPFIVGRESSVRALEEAKKKGITTIAFLGRDGGFTKGIADLEIIVTGSNTARIQEGHKLLFHVLCQLVDQKLPKA